MHTEEHEAHDDDANYEIGVTEESFTLQARGTFGQANELILSLRRPNNQIEESSVQSFVGLQESPLGS
jgi:hypothetical protein